MDISTQLAAGAGLSFLIQFVKKSQRIPFINKESAKVNRWAAIVGSGLVSLGLHATYSAVNHSLLITGLDATTIGVGLWHWFTQFALAHGWYQATKEKEPAV